MFEDMTYEKILQNALSRVDSDIDKRQGSIIFDALAPFCAELAQAYIQLDRVLSESFGDTASREYLIKRAGERGLSVYPASRAVIRGAFDCMLNVGDRFNLGEYNYAVTQYIDFDSYYYYKLECETEGECGNQLGRLIPIESIAGLSHAQATELITLGEDEEDTEAFRQRYLDSLLNQGFGGNTTDYRNWVKAIDGIGGVKVFKADDWLGAGTVRVVIQASDFTVVSADKVSEVQEKIDPSASGSGVGIAPIGHQVTVSGADGVELEISAELTLEEGETLSEVRVEIEEKITQYLMELNSQWESVDRITVFAMQLGARALEVNGVSDISNIEINGSQSNLRLGQEQIIDISSLVFDFGGE